MTTHLSTLLPCVPRPQAVTPKSTSTIGRLCERGMATAEYAVGILAAIALALVLLRIFTNQDFFSEMLKQVIGILGKMSGMLP